MADHDVAIVGAGIAGLQCARMLLDAGLDVHVIEAADAVGGRIRTDVVDGYLVDRGFQLLNPAYPAVRRTADVAALRLQQFDAGVAARLDDRLQLLGHPLRAPRLLPATLAALASRPGEAARLARWLSPVVRAGGLAGSGDVSLRTSLDLAGVDGTLRTVLERFLSGVLLEDDQSTSAAYVLLLLRSLALGTPGLPSAGMQALPEQLASSLEGRVSLQQPVEALGGEAGAHVLSVAGRRLHARRVVLATAAPETAALTGTRTAATKGVVTQWFAADEPTTAVRLLHVDARARAAGPVVNTAVVSAVAPSYAPAGRHLVQASALLPPDAPAPSEQELRLHAGELLGAASHGWRSVARHEVRHALPVQPPPFDERRGIVTDRGIVLCGDHRATASIQGALVSGARAARAVLRTS